MMPPGFDHPMLWGPIDIWQPLTFTPEQKANRRASYLFVWSAQAWRLNPAGRAKYGCARR